LCQAGRAHRRAEQKYLSSGNQPRADRREIFDAGDVAKGGDLMSGTFQLPEHWPPGKWRAAHAMDE
jgi:hypothetical protein